MERASYYSELYIAHCTSHYTLYITLHTLLSRMAYLEWPNSSRNAKKNFCYHVILHTPGVGGQNPKCQKFHTFFIFSSLTQNVDSGETVE